VVWENLARSQAERLRQANERLLPKNQPARLLVASAPKRLPAARRLAELLKAKLLLEERTLDVQLWEDAFPTGELALGSLMSRLDEWDFAVFLLTPDDIVISGMTVAYAPRDNVAFRAGLCIGRLGRRRTLLLRRRKAKNLKVPCDLSDVTLYYDAKPHEVVEDIQEIVEARGSRSRVAIDDLS
jgi:predicted nucleotide-binding protein